jgi:hypothetical protein
MEAAVVVDERAGPRHRGRRAYVARGHAAVVAERAGLLDDLARE